MSLPTNHTHLLSDVRGLRGSHGAVVAPAPPLLAMTTQERLTVLIVEDDRDTVLSLMLLLRSEGYETRAVGNAKAMWDGFGDFDPDVILIDINLPDRSGYDIARDLRRTYEQNSVRPVLVAVTAWNKALTRSSQS